MTRSPSEGSPEDVQWSSATGEPLLVDPVDIAPFNPLDTRNLGIAVAKALLEKKPLLMNAVPPFRGAGIYVIYYRGSFTAYRLMAEANRDHADPRWPIYVGKAIPPGGRRGTFNLAATDTAALFNRLREHSDSLRAAQNLNIADFACRFLVVQDLWIPLAEQLLIAHFSPVWNRLVDGFGNHDPGAGRYGGLRPRWDVLHPGRTWADRCKQRDETVEDITREAEQYLRNAALPSLATLRGDFSGK